MDTAYGFDSATAIVDALEGTGVEEAAAAASAILSKSPTAVSVTLEALRRARGLGSLEEALAQEFRVSLRSIQQPDFLEGVRAQVIDKDRNP
ncbi:MAG TPA: enoyl-CoA hydratase/isomerase family protein, partial [Terrimesophilobacter sp.]|nr:enoyl-CoA hydratase/isomerase family protein [Terrimesophilobacter sp.]